VPWLRRLAAGLSPWRCGFIFVSIYVRFVVDKVALGHVFAKYCGISLSVPFDHCSILIFIYMLLDKKEKRAKPGNLPQSSSLSEIGGHCTEDYCHFIPKRVNIVEICLCFMQNACGPHDIALTWPVVWKTLMQFVTCDSNICRIGWNVWQAVVWRFLCCRVP
jgi:hypothetical protein